VFKHVISFGKQDDWLGPGLGSGMAYSNNAENIYSFRINRIEPLTIPLLSRLTGPFATISWLESCGAHFYAQSRLYRQPFAECAERNQSWRSLGARGEIQLQAYPRSRVRLRAHCHMGGEGTSPSLCTPS